MFLKFQFEYVKNHAERGRARFPCKYDKVVKISYILFKINYLIINMHPPSYIYLISKIFLALVSKLSGCQKRIDLR